MAAMFIFESPFMQLEENNVMIDIVAYDRS